MMEDGNTPQTVASGDFLGVWTWNVQTEIVVACQDVCHYADIPSETGIHGVPTERFYAAIHPDDQAELSRRVDQTLRGNDAFSAEYRLTSVRYGTVLVRSTGRCFQDEAGRPTHISGYLSRIDGPEESRADDEAVLTKVTTHLTDARNAADKLSSPVLSRLISAVLLKAGFQLANLVRRN
ncbi:PAS domain-containing protein [Aureimonas sp. Leaf324]|uniref:PAS domain-containing protein n=1 Tax=Aureimonas sp. Leaf324 TaxID=1736336 RepID=UPI0009E79CC7|nr:PAS domain-containing protein [Aureimonas sp. Leaf324]